MSPNRANLREARQKKMLCLVLFEQISCKTQPFFQISDSKSSKFQCFGKNSRALGKKLKHFEKKLKLFGSKTQRTGSGSLHPTTIKVVKKKACVVCFGLLYYVKDTINHCHELIWKSFFSPGVRRMFSEGNVDYVRFRDEAARV